jgi:hypothetical protein
LIKPTTKAHALAGVINALQVQPIIIHPEIKARINDIFITFNNPIGCQGFQRKIIVRCRNIKLITYGGNKQYLKKTDFKLGKAELTVNLSLV